MECWSDGLINIWEVIRFGFKAAVDREEVNQSGKTNFSPARRMPYPPGGEARL